MKVIDLLNKIANGEVRHDIKINTRNYYCSIEEYLKEFGINEDTLNVEVIGFDDIIEKEKKIPERLEEFDIQGLEVSGHSMTQAEYLLEDGVKENREMINWILDYLKSKGE